MRLYENDQNLASVRENVLPTVPFDVSSQSKPLALLFIITFSCRWPTAKLIIIIILFQKSRMLRAI